MAKNNGISRRDAIKTAGLAGAGAAAATFASSGPADAALPAKWDRTADVVVIGSGARGMLAALVAPLFLFIRLNYRIIMSQLWHPKWRKQENTMKQLFSGTSLSQNVPDRNKVST